MSGSKAQVLGIIHCELGPDLKQALDIQSLRTKVPPARRLRSILMNDPEIKDILLEVHQGKHNNR